MTAKLFEAALGIASPWYINGVEFDVAKKTLSIAVDFIAGSRFAVPGVEGSHPAHDIVPKRYRHLNFFQHECHLEVRVPRVRLPDGGIRQVEPNWAGRPGGFRFGDYWKLGLPLEIIVVAISVPMLLIVWPL